MSHSVAWSLCNSLSATLGLSFRPCTLEVIPSTEVQPMLTDYIRAAMHRATYKIFPEDETFLGTIPGFQGVWANNDTLEGCRDELQEVLEEWILFRLSKQLALPLVDGIDLTLKQAV